MKKNELQRFDNGLSLLTIRATGYTILNEFSLIENGALLRSLLQSFVLTLSSRQNVHLVVKNESLKDYLRTTVELSLPLKVANGQVCQFSLLATLTNDPNALNETTLDTSVCPHRTQHKKPSERTEAVIVVGSIQDLLEGLDIWLDD